MLSMMIAKCFAKGCHQKSNEKEEKDMKKWRPCMGCRSHWLHVTCGGFCSDCQPSSSPIEAMKDSFCSQIEEKTGRKCLKRSADRSPLSIRQKSQMSKRLEDSLGFKEGKENTSIVLGKRQRKPVQPPCLTPNPIIISPVKKSSPSVNNESKFKRPSEGAKPKAAAKKRKISVEKSLEPPGKKAKKTVSTAPGGTPKKYPSEPHTKFKEKLVKKVVEVKMAEDGTHNPDRLLFHVRSNQPIDKGEVEAEESYDWLKDLSHRQIDDFVDLNEGEKALFKLWNGHLHKYPCYGDDMMIPVLEMFIDSYGPQIHRRSLYKNFILHLSNFHDFGILSSSMVLKMTTRLQTIIKDMIDNPKPATPEKLPIENPYYVPKPIPMSESLHLHLSEDDEEGLNKKNATAKTTIVFKEKARSSRNFWLKKSFRNPAASSIEAEAGDSKVWPRKKAVVTFANEVFVDEIRDMNDVSSKSQYDVNDIFKLTTWISPRQRKK